MTHRTLRAWWLVVGTAILAPVANGATLPERMMRIRKVPGAAGFPLAAGRGFSGLAAQAAPKETAREVASFAGWIRRSPSRRATADACTTACRSGTSSGTTAAGSWDTPR